MPQHSTAYSAVHPVGDFFFWTPGPAAQVFEHLHSLDFTYHVGRQTGGLARAIDRGTRGINFILSSMIFNVVPTALEVLLVAGILAYKCGPPLAALALATLAAYTWFTFAMTAWRTQFRVRMNKMDAKASTRAVDALLNYETVWTSSISPPLAAQVSRRRAHPETLTCTRHRRAAWVARQAWRAVRLWQAVRF